MQTQVEISGKNIRDRHTHYEASLHIGPEPATLIINGAVASDFQKKYGRPMGTYDALQVTTSFIRNEQMIPECRDPFRSPSHLFGRVASLEDIIIPEKD